MRKRIKLVLYVYLLHIRLIIARVETIVVLPHGDFAYDPKLLKPETSARKAADTIALASRLVGEWLSGYIDPDLIFLSTPHGTSLSRDFGVYLDDTADGSVLIGNDMHSPEAPSYTVELSEISLSPIESRGLVDQLSAFNVTGILHPENPVQLYWGAVIPLLLIPPRTHKSEQSIRSTINKDRKHMILSHPLRRYTDAPSMVSELIELGSQIFNYLDGLQDKVAVVISADLSHTHRADGPYGYSNSSSVFDKAIGRWAMDPCNGLDYLYKARDLQPHALSCGFTGLVMSHGMLIRDSSVIWDAKVLANANATYYGMMVARFVRRDG